MTPSIPLEIEGMVASFHDGKYTETQPRHGGETGGDIGWTAVVRADSRVTIMLMRNRGGPNFSTQPIMACGLYPNDSTSSSRASIPQGVPMRSFVPP